jgi:hypothetical protein
MNGELLGYGARHMLETPSHEVRIFKGDELVLYFFISNHDENLAEKIAGEGQMISSGPLAGPTSVSG